MLNVVFTGSFAARLAEPVRVHLTLPCQLIVADEAGILAHLADADVLVSMRFSASMAEAGQRLRLLQGPGAGLARIARSVLRPGTRLANAYGHEGAIAEDLIGAMIALGRGFARLDGKLRQGQWESQWAMAETAPAPWPELAGKRLGSLGFGDLGRVLARRAAAFGMEVLAVHGSAPTEATDGAALVSGPEGRDDTLRRLDFLAITLPVSAATRNLIDARRPQVLKPTAFSINVARAEIVEEATLYQALSRKRLASAAFDVWRQPQASPCGPPGSHFRGGTTC